jgi:tRNA (cmo5U34)-methyltransferase
MTKHWTFEDSDLANNFGQHVRGQLPWYDLATGLVRCIAENYLPEDGLMYDIGASTGNITSACADLIESRSVHAISIEPSQEMCKKWKGKGDLVNDFAENYNFKEYDFAVCFLTFMFIRASKRRGVFDLLRSKIKEGGSLVIVDKFEGSGGYADTVRRRMTMRQKIASGEDAQSILDKELSLSGVQRPLGSEYADGEKFFQIGEFHGIIFSHNSQLANGEN